MQRFERRSQRRRHAVRPRRSQRRRALRPRRLQRACDACSAHDVNRSAALTSGCTAAEINRCRQSAGDKWLHLAASAITTCSRKVSETAWLHVQSTCRGQTLCKHEAPLGHFSLRKWLLHPALLLKTYGFLKHIHLSQPVQREYKAVARVRRARTGFPASMRVVSRAQRDRRAPTELRGECTTSARHEPQSRSDQPRVHCRSSARRQAPAS